jgi:hypothetical protein
MILVKYVLILAVAERVSLSACRLIIVRLGNLENSIYETRQTGL